MTKLAFFGASGDLRSHLIPRLSNLGYICFLIDDINFQTDLSPQELSFEYYVLDFGNRNQLIDTISQINPNIIISLLDFGNDGLDVMNGPICSLNYEFTENLLNACKVCGVSKFIYTSTDRVIFSETPIINGDESLSYLDPKAYLDTYSRSKYLAESLVYNVNGCEIFGNDILITSIIRPSQIYGTKSCPFFNRLINFIDSGLFWFKFESTTTSYVHIDNLVRSHLNIDKIPT